MRIQLNSILFQKTLVRKDVASSSASEPEGETKEKKDDEDDFSSKAQIMTLMTTDVDRVSEFSWHLFTIVDAPIEILIGTLFLYSMLGVSCFFGLAVTCLFLPMNHFAGKVVVGAQDNLMKARDERVSLMNEVSDTTVASYDCSAHSIPVIDLGRYSDAEGITRVSLQSVYRPHPVFQFMAWERSFEARVHKIRERELKYQKLNYTIEVLWNAIW